MDIEVRPWERVKVQIQTRAVRTIGKLIGGITWQSWRRELAALSIVWIATPFAKNPGWLLK